MHKYLPEIAISFEYLMPIVESGVRCGAAVLLPDKVCP